MENLIKNLQKRGFDVILAKDKNEAFKIAKEFIKNSKSIGLGGSKSVEEIGLLEYLSNLKNIQIFNQYEAGISPEENIYRRRNGILADLYITSSNAITKQGELVNIDGSGNRIAAQIYGPKKLLLIVGKNKIVENIEAGFKRIKEIVAPKNLERLNKKSYCVDDILNKSCVIFKDEPKRTTIILVDENLGF